jgi:hypothetical protein
MGGRALKNEYGDVITKRVDAESFEIISKRVISIFKKEFPNRMCECPKFYRQKSDFGDIDILFQAVGCEVDLEQFIADHFHPRCTIVGRPNGSSKLDYENKVISFDYIGCQIDVICTSQSNFKTSFEYFSWNDLGNLIGRIAFKFGLKYGVNGLTLPIYEVNDKGINVDFIEEIEVSRDTKTILHFLGFDYNVYKDGFDTLEDIFKFVASSKYFNRNLFSLNNRNSKSRVRDTKRSTYKQFLEWLKNNQFENEYPWTVEDERGGRKLDPVLLVKIFEQFPEAEVQFKRVMTDLELKRRSHERFNGHVVHELTGLEGAEIKSFVKQFKEVFGFTNKKEFDVFVSLKNTDDSIKQSILWLHNLNQSNQRKS